MNRLTYMWYDRKYLRHKKLENFQWWVANHLPKSIAKWTFYRVLANACGSKYPDQIVPELTWQQAADRWEENPG